MKHLLTVFSFVTFDDLVGLAESCLQAIIGRKSPSILYVLIFKMEIYFEINYSFLFIFISFSDYTHHYDKK